MHRLDSDEGNESKVGPKARTLASLHPVDSDPGPHRMPLMDLKSAPRPGLEIQWDPVDSDPGPNLMNRMHLTKGPRPGL